MDTWHSVRLCLCVCKSTVDLKVYISVHLCVLAVCVCTQSLKLVDSLHSEWVGLSLIEPPWKTSSHCAWRCSWASACTVTQWLKYNPVTLNLFQTSYHRQCKTIYRVVLMYGSILAHVKRRMPSRKTRCVHMLDSYLFFLWWDNTVTWHFHLIIHLFLPLCQKKGKERAPYSFIRSTSHLKPFQVYYRMLSHLIPAIRRKFWFPLL